MPIFRGTGGSTSTTDQATIDQVTEDAATATIKAAEAASSASNAASSATSAATSASNAATQATNASNSATTASTQATNAATSATAAAASASSANTSAGIASDSIEFAEEWATKAEDSLISTDAGGDGSTDYSSLHHAAKSAASATSAASSASTATTKASEASTSATNAATSATAAASSASAASTSATASAGSATSAASSATAASNAQTAAESARDSALAAYDNFDDRYLGAKSSDPTLDNDGNALVAGALYFNTSSEVMKLYTGSAWVAAYVSAEGLVQSTGDSMTGNLSFGDNVYARFGDSDDLQIYHSGTYSLIEEQGTGNLFIYGTDLRLGSTAGEDYIQCVADGAVTLYYDNAAKLSTTSTGIDVTGTVTADGLTVENSSFPTLNINNASGTRVQLEYDTNNAIGKLRTTVTAPLVFETDNTERMRIDSNGNVGIGTSSTTFKFNVSSASSTTANLASTTSSSVLRLTNSGGLATLGSASNDIYFTTSLTERMRIDSNGNVGIGTNSPDASYKLTVSGASTGIVPGVLIQDTVGKSFGVYSASNSLIFRDYTGAAERMRIDSSGNLLVGKTSSSFSTVGVEATSTGKIRATMSSDNPISLNRTTTDGDIAVFAKDGATVGSIGSRSSGTALQIYTSNTGIDFGGDGILPMVGSTITDNSRDIGSGSYRFKDLYLSGTARAARGLGDTETASKTGSVTPDMDTYQNFVWTLTGNVTLSNPSDEAVGQSGFFVFIQDGTGSRTVSLGTDYETAGGAGLTLSSTASTTDVVPYIVAASGRIILGAPQLAFS